MVAANTHIVEMLGSQRIIFALRETTLRLQDIQQISVVICMRRGRAEYKGGRRQQVESNGTHVSPKGNAGVSCFCLSCAVRQKRLRHEKATLPRQGLAKSIGGIETVPAQIRPTLVELTTSGRAEVHQCNT
jgi:hypothetical protein